MQSGEPWTIQNLFWSLLAALVAIVGPTLASIGSSRDYPELTRKLFRWAERIPLFLLPFIAVAVLLCLLVFLASQVPEERFFGLAAATGFLLLVKTAFRAPVSGSMRMRKFRRVVVSYSHFLTWLLGGLTVTYLVAEVMPRSM